MPKGLGYPKKSGNKKSTSSKSGRGTQMKTSQGLKDSLKKNAMKKRNGR